jgi:hypothetical protein
MAGLRPGHPRLASLIGKKDVDARVKPGHDDLGRNGTGIAQLIRWRGIQSATTGTSG